MKHPKHPRALAAAALAAALLLGGGSARAEEPEIPPSEEPAPELEPCPRLHQGVGYLERADGRPGRDRVYRAGADPCRLQEKRRDERERERDAPPVFIRIDERR